MIIAFFMSWVPLYFVPYAIRPFSHVLTVILNNRIKLITSVSIMNYSRAKLKCELWKMSDQISNVLQNKH